MATPLSRIAIESGKADVSLWHRAQQARPASPAGGRRPVYARAPNREAQRMLAQLGARAPLNSWSLVQLDEAQLHSALFGPSALQLRSAPAHRPLGHAAQPLSSSLQDIDLHSLILGPHATARGKGVLVGIIDTGIDLYHPAFRHSNGASRVVAFWDQDAVEGPAPEPFFYGRVCYAQGINAGECPLQDPIGHGTHVAGIAAGNRGTGIASDADLAVVSSSDFTRLADAVAFLVALAASRGEAVVVNISVGGQYGPHDGLTPLEIFLNDTAAEPGRIFVAAAGNDGADSIHVSGTLSETATRVGLRGLPVGTATQSLVELWTPAAEELQVAVELWIDGGRAAVLVLPAHRGEFTSGDFQYNGATVAHISFFHDDVTDNGAQRHAVLMDRTRARMLPQGGMLALAIVGHGQVQGWISQSDYNSGDSRFATGLGPGWLAGDSQRSIAVPATARTVLAVGSYAVQTSWLSQMDGMQTLANVVLGSISAFSSLGPTGFPQTTGFKPDLCAPGSVVLSARAASVPDSVQTVTSNLMVMQGTSMAAPHVAGVVALMLEANPTLDVRQVRDLLRQSARADEFTGSLPNHSWGYGKLHAPGAVRAAERSATSGCQAAPAAVWNLPYSGLLGLALWRLLGGRNAFFRNVKK